MSEKVIMNFAKGKENCEHDWVYSKNGQMQMTFPMIYTCARICNKCGKHQMIELDKMPKSTNNFTEVVKQFEKE